MVTRINRILISIFTRAEESWCGLVAQELKGLFCGDRHEIDPTTVVVAAVKAAPPRRLVVRSPCLVALFGLAKKYVRIFEGNGVRAADLSRIFEGGLLLGVPHI